jgi:hypothetical protein
LIFTDQQELDCYEGKRLFRHVEAIRERLALISPFDFPEPAAPGVTPGLKAVEKGVAMTCDYTSRVELDAMVYTLYPYDLDLDSCFWGKVIRVRDDPVNHGHFLYDVWFAEDHHVRVNVPRSELYMEHEVVCVSTFIL